MSSSAHIEYEVQLENEEQHGYVEDTLDLMKDQLTTLDAAIVHDQNTMLQEHGIFSFKDNPRTRVLPLMRNDVFALMMKYLSPTELDTKVYMLSKNARALRLFEWRRAAGAKKSKIKM